MYPDIYENIASALGTHWLLGNPNLPGAVYPCQAITLSEPLDLVFSNATREAVFPVVQRWVNNHDAELISSLGPIVQRWMEEHFKNHQVELISSLGPILQRWIRVNEKPSLGSRLSSPDEPSH